MDRYGGLVLGEPGAPQSVTRGPKEAERPAGVLASTAATRPALAARGDCPGDEGRDCAPPSARMSADSSATTLPLRTLRGPLLKLELR